MCTSLNSALPCPSSSQVKIQRTICTESDEGLGVCREAGEGRNRVGQVDPAEYRNWVPDLMEGFIYTTAEVAFHPLTHISHRFQLSYSQTRVPVLSAQDCVCVMQRTRDASCHACLRFSLAGDNDIRQLFSVLWEPTVFGGFPLLCLPSWQAGRRSNGGCGASSSCWGAVAYQSMVLQARWELHLPELD